MAAFFPATSFVAASFAAGPSTTLSSTSACVPTTRPTLPVKIFFETTHAREIRRTRIATDATWEEAIQLFGGLFPDSYVVVSYVDADGDTVTVETPFEWKEALRQHVQAFGFQHTLRITLDATQPASHIQTQHHVQHSAPPQFAPTHHAYASSYPGPSSYSPLDHEPMMYTPITQPQVWANFHPSPDVVSLDSHEQSFATNSPHHLGEDDEEDQEEVEEEEPEEDQESADEESVRTLPAEVRAEIEDEMADRSSYLSSSASSSTGAAQNQRGLRAFLPASLSAMVDETVGEFVKQTSSSITSTLRGAFNNMREVAEHVFEVPMLEPQDQHPQRQGAPVVPPLPVPVAAEQEMIEEQRDEEAATENDTYSSEFEDEEPELPEAFEVEEVHAQMPPPPYAPSAPAPVELTADEILFHMGFTDANLVRQVLQDNHNDVGQALDALLAAAAETPRQ